MIGQKRKTSGLFYHFLLGMVIFSKFLLCINLFAQEELKWEEEEQAAAQSELSKEPDQTKIEAEDAAFKFAGYAKTSLYGANLQAENLEHSVLLLQNLKLNLGGRYFSKQFEANMQLDQSLLFSNANESMGFKTFSANYTRNKLIPDLYQEKNYDFIYLSVVKIGYVKYQSDTLIVSGGRQKVSWGEGRFLNPMDLISPINPGAFDLEDNVGTDLFQIHYFFTAFDSVQIICVPYLSENRRDLQTLKGEDVNYLARLKMTFDFLDAVLLSGRHFHSLVFGGEINAALLDASVRFSYLARREEKRIDSYTTPGNYREIPAAWMHQMVAGVSYAFLGGKLQTTFEFFYSSEPLNQNSFLKMTSAREKLICMGLETPEKNDPTFFATAGRVLTKNSFLLQAGSHYQIHELVEFNLFIMCDLEGRSLFIHPGISLSLGDEVGLNLGANLYFYRKQNSEKAEFGEGQSEGLVYLKWNF